MEFSHKSVLLWECIDALNIRPNGIYLDGTLGGGGHSLEICRLGVVQSLTATRSFALLARGFSRTSSIVAMIGFFVKT